jgi:hypothetical protein
MTPKEIVTWLCKKSGLIFSIWIAMVIVATLPQKQAGEKHQPPRAVKEVKAEIVPEGIKVEWKEVPGATHYTIFWSNESGQYTKLHNVPENAALFTELRHEKYFFTVTAWNERGESDYAPEVGIDVKERRLVKMEK